MKKYEYSRSYAICVDGEIYQGECKTKYNGLITYNIIITPQRKTVNGHIINGEIKTSLTKTKALFLNERNGVKQLGTTLLKGLYVNIKKTVSESEHKMLEVIFVEKIEEFENDDLRLPDDDLDLPF